VLSCQNDKFKHLNILFRYRIYYKIAKKEIFLIHRRFWTWLMVQGLSGQQQPSMPMVHPWAQLHDKLTLGISGTGSSHDGTVYLFIR
jgi:hypothetical protein